MTPDETRKTGACDMYSDWFIFIVRVVWSRNRRTRRHRRTSDAVALFSGTIPDQGLDREGACVAEKNATGERTTCD